MDHQQDQEVSPHNAHLYHLLKGDGWAVAQDIMKEKMDILRDVGNIPNDLTNEQLARETSGRIYALALIEDWFAEIKTRAENYAASMEEAEEETDHVVRQ